MQRQHSGFSTLGTSGPKLPEDSDNPQVFTGFLQSLRLCLDLVTIASSQIPSTSLFTNSPTPRPIQSQIQQPCNTICPSPLKIH